MFVAQVFVDTPNIVFMVLYEVLFTNIWHKIFFSKTQQDTNPVSGQQQTI